jgi:hypothetical protein
METEEEEKDLWKNEDIQLVVGVCVGVVIVGVIIYLSYRRKPAVKEQEMVGMTYARKIPPSNQNDPDPEETSFQTRLRNWSNPPNADESYM